MNPLSSLGVGSGVLNYDVIDKLRKVDESTQITPIDRKIQANIAKQTELAGLKSLLSSLNSSTKKIADYSTYLGRNAISSDENKLKVNVNAGVPTQDISIKIDSTAKNSVNEIGKKFANRSDIFSRFNTSLHFKVGEQEYTIAISSTDTLEEVAQKIIDNTNGAVNASIMKTGSGNQAYSLMINSKESGDENNIFFGNLLESKEIPSNINLGEKDFNISLITANGTKKTLNITANGNANSLKEAIISTLNNDGDFANLVQNGNINVALSADGKQLLINDSRGFEIIVGGEKAGTLFTDMNAEERDTVIGTKAIDGGIIKGIVSIGSENIDFGDITSNGNSAEDNKQAIIDAINKIDGYSARITKDGFLAINSATGSVTIRASEDSKSALTMLGIEAGEYKDWGVNDIGVTNIQRASDAKFSYNGIQVSRPSNVVDDVVTGVTLELIGESENPINVSISRDNEAIIDEIKAFVESYNTLIAKLEELTRYDEDTKIAGVFNGNTDIRAIRSNLRRVLGMTRYENDKNISLASFGFDFTDNGRMLFNENKLRQELSANPDAVMNFFRNSQTMINGKEVEQNGVFSLVEKELDSLVGIGDSRLKLFEENLSNDDKRLKDERKRNLDLLNSRYETMANRFAAYDSQIAKTNNTANHLNMLIEQSIADKRK